MKRYGPKGPESLAIGRTCIVCRKRIQVGDYVTTLGTDETEVIHWECRPRPEGRAA